MIFEKLIGNDKIKEELADTIKSNNVSHSYLFAGPEGIGKKLFAKEFAKACLCLSEEKPCSKCSSCVKFDGENNPDYKEIGPDGNSIKIAQIRELQERIYEKPIDSSKKVIVIDDSDKMTEEAQNGLLKTLEEPPEYAIIILIATNENKLLNTVKSRCLKISFSAIADSEVKKYILQNNIIESPSENILKVCGGSLGKVKHVAENLEIYSQIEDVTNKLIAGNIKNMVDMFNKFQVLYDNKDNVLELLDYMIVIIYSFIIQKQNFSIKWLSIVQIIEKSKIKLNSNTNTDMCIDELLMNIFEKI